MLAKIDFEKGGGLVSAILQDYNTGQVLMLGYMNQEAYNKTLEDQVVWFYSRSKERLWMKGEESRHIQRLVSIDLDCDQDCLLVKVDPQGPTCHLGTLSCFGDGYFCLEILEKTIAYRIENPKEGSYTSYLVEEGLDKILKKCGEELTELVIASKNQDPEEIVNEAADLIYHLLVLFNIGSVDLWQIKVELASRHGIKQSYSIREEIKNW